jgi:hypothetical protein
MNFEPHVDKHEAFEREVSHLLHQLVDACKRNGFPLVLMLQHSEDLAARIMLLPTNAAQTLFALGAVLEPERFVFVEPIDSDGEAN